MPETEKRTIEITKDDSRYLDSLVTSGAYSSSAEVIEAGLRVLRQREEELDRWMRDEVLPVVDRMDAEPDRALPAEEVFASIRALHAQRAKS